MHTVHGTVVMNNDAQSGSHRWVLKSNHEEFVCYERPLTAQAAEAVFELNLGTLVGKSVDIFYHSRNGNTLYGARVGGEQGDDHREHKQCCQHDSAERRRL